MFGGKGVELSFTNEHKFTKDKKRFFVLVNLETLVYNFQDGNVLAERKAKSWNQAF